MRTVTQGRCYCVRKFGRDLWQSRKLGSLCFACKENNGNSKHHINGLMRMKFLAFSNDIICNATLAHGDLVALTLCCTIFQEEQLWIQVTTTVVWTKSMWAHEVFNKAEAASAWLVKIASHEQPTIKLAMCRSISCQNEMASLNALIMTSFIEPLLFVALIHNSCPWNVQHSISIATMMWHHVSLLFTDKGLVTWWAVVCWVRPIRQMAVNHLATHFLFSTSLVPKPNQQRKDHVKQARILACAKAL